MLESLTSPSASVLLSPLRESSLLLSVHVIGLGPSDNSDVLPTLRTTTLITPTKTLFTINITHSQVPGIREWMSLGTPCLLGVHSL